MARFGSLGTQYFDNSGDPLVNGLIYFYESGTTTPKTTYADAELATANTNPVVLSAAGRQPNVFFDGAAKAVLATSASVQIEVRDPVGDTGDGAQFSDWSAIVAYAVGEVAVGSDGVFYISLVSNNLGNNPISSPTDWEPLIDTLLEQQTLVDPGFMIIGASPEGITALDVTAKGSIAAGTGSTMVEVAVGTDGYPLVADSTELAGIGYTTPGTVGGIKLILATEAAAIAAVDFTDLSSDYDEYLVCLQNVIPATDGAVLHMRTSTDNGATFDSGVSDYSYSYYWSDYTAAMTSTGSAGAAQIVVSDVLGSSANEQGASFWVHVIRPSDAAYCIVNWQGCCTDSGGDLQAMSGAAKRNAAANVDAIRFYMNSGNIESGKFKLFGVAKQ